MSHGHLTEKENHLDFCASQPQLGFLFPRMLASSLHRAMISWNCLGSGK